VVVPVVGEFWPATGSGLVTVAGCVPIYPDGYCYKLLSMETVQLGKYPQALAVCRRYQGTAEPPWRFQVHFSDNRVHLVATMSQLALTRHEVLYLLAARPRSGVGGGYHHLTLRETARYASYSDEELVEYRAAIIANGVPVKYASEVMAEVREYQLDKGYREPTPAEALLRGYRKPVVEEDSEAEVAPPPAPLVKYSGMSSGPNLEVLQAASSAGWGFLAKATGMLVSTTATVAVVGLGGVYATGVDMVRGVQEDLAKLQRQRRLEMNQRRFRKVVRAIIAARRFHCGGVKYRRRLVDHCAAKVAESVALANRRRRQRIASLMGRFRVVVSAIIAAGRLERGGYRRRAKCEVAVQTRQALFTREVACWARRLRNQRAFSGNRSIRALEVRRARALMRLVAAVDWQALGKRVPVAPAGDEVCEDPVEGPGDAAVVDHDIVVAAKPEVTEKVCGEHPKTKPLALYRAASTVGSKLVGGTVWCSSLTLAGLAWLFWRLTTTLVALWRGVGGVQHRDRAKKPPDIEESEPESSQPIDVPFELTAYVEGLKEFEDNMDVSSAAVINRDPRTPPDVDSPDTAETRAEWDISDPGEEATEFDDKSYTQSLESEVDDGWREYIESQRVETDHYAQFESEIASDSAMDSNSFRSAWSGTEAEEEEEEEEGVVGYASSNHRTLVPVHML